MSYPSAPTPATLPSEAVDVSALVGLPPGPRFLTLCELGIGAMGRVVRAYDTKLQREVALKTVHDASLQPRGRARLLREARAMARVTHGNVVRVWDVLEAGSRVCIAMEIVDGQTLQAWLAHERPWPEIVEVFAAAARGLQAAHAAGLLHRDFKPANVMVGEEGRIVKVTDFGLAQRSDRGGTLDPDLGASGASETDSTHTDLTGHGMVVGTPRYMAPEQHAGRELGPGVDQYALCISLWEALTGQPPFAGEHLLRSKLAGPPPWPDGVATRRIGAALRRGLSPYPEQRWPSLDALVRALRPRRRRIGGGWTVGAIGVGAAAFAMGRGPTEGPCEGGDALLAEVWSPAQREAAARALRVADTTAVHQRDAVALLAALDAFAERWPQQYRAACLQTQRGEASEADLDLQMTCLRRARIDFAGATRLVAEADATVVAKASKIVQGLPELDPCEDLERLRAEVAPPPPSLAPAVEGIRAVVADAEMSRTVGKFHDALAGLEHAETQARAVDYPALQTELQLKKGRVLYEFGRLAESEAAFRSAVERGLALSQWSLVRAAILELTMVVGSLQARYDEGLAYLRLGRAWVEHTPVLREQAWIHTALGRIHRQRHELDDAEREARIALSLWTQVDPHHANVGVAHNNLASVLYDRGDTEAALQAYREALSVKVAALGPDHPELASTHNNLGAIHARRGEYEAAEAAFRESRRIRVLSLSEDSRSVADVDTNIATILVKQRRFDEALEVFQRVRALRERDLGPDHPSVGEIRDAIGVMLRHHGDLEGSEREGLAALEILSKAQGPDHLDVASPHHNLGLLYSEQGQLDAAERHFRRALQVWIAQRGPTSAEAATGYVALGGLLLRKGEPRPAREVFELALDIRTRLTVPGHERADAALSLARAEWTLGERAAARRHAALAEQDYAAAGPSFGERRQIAEAYARGRPR